MARRRPSTMVSQAKFVKAGYGQVEPNHLSAQLNGQVYANLPAKADINILENGQFVKYDYANGVCDFTGAGEWMLVFNEVKIYRDFEDDSDFAMLKDDYSYEVYAPYDGADLSIASGLNYKSIAKDADPYVIDSTNNPMQEGWAEKRNQPELKGSVRGNMVPRVFKTMVGDIFTTNLVDEESLAVADILAPRAADGILVKDDTQAMKFQVVKVYTMPDNQPGVKLMRIA